MEENPLPVVIDKTKKTEDESSYSNSEAADNNYPNGPAAAEVDINVPSYEPYYSIGDDNVKAYKDDNQNEDNSVKKDEDVVIESENNNYSESFAEAKAFV